MAVFKTVDPPSGILRTKPAILNPFQNARYQDMTGGDPEALSVPCGLICIIHTQASTISIYQLTPFKINGAISRILRGGVFPASLTFSLQLASSPSFPVPAKMPLSSVPG